MIWYSTYLMAVNIPVDDDIVCSISLIVIGTGGSEGGTFQG